MGEIQQRDYMFDTFRGLLIVLVLVLHFTRVAGNFSQASLGGVIYITLISNVNHALIFLSGFFSKNPDRSKQTSFHTLMWPYILGIPFFYCVRYIIWGSANWNLATPPFAMWYLWVLFFYRYFTKEWMRVPHILALSVLMYLLAGQIPFLTDIFGLGRLISFFPFFIIAVYCTKDQIKKVQCLKKWHCLLLGTALTGISCVLAFCVPQLPVEFYLLKRPAGALGISWYWDIIGRVIVMATNCGWIILLLNILPGRRNYLSYVGMNTMPIYILHVIVRYLVKKHTILFGVLPENQVVYYLMIFALAGLCVLVLSSKPVVKMYDFVVEGLWKVFLGLIDRCKNLLARVQNLLKQ